jgi:endonuclease III
MILALFLVRVNVLSINRSIFHSYHGSSHEIRRMTTSNVIPTLMSNSKGFTYMNRPRYMMLCPHSQSSRLRQRRDDGSIPLASEVIKPLSAENNDNLNESNTIHSEIGRFNDLDNDMIVTTSYRDRVWRSQYQMISDLRLSNTSPVPVDTMGAEALAVSQGRSGDASFRFSTLVATMLSPQTRDEQTSAAFHNLQALVKPREFKPSVLQHIPVGDIEDAIRMTSFYRIKAKNVIAASKACSELYNDDIPSNIDDLLKFAGVGPKIAYLTFSIAWSQDLGICVDTHVHRITNRLGWVTTWHKSNGPEKTRVELQQFLPQSLWYSINGLFVGFGQSICDAKNPKCGSCSLSSSCKFYNDPTHRDWMKKKVTK